MIDKDELDWITIGLVVKAPIEEIPIIKKYLIDKGMLVYSKVSAGRLYLTETSPDDGDKQSE